MTSAQVARQDALKAIRWHMWLSLALAARPPLPPAQAPSYGA